MSRIKNAFHDEICWNALDDDEKADVFYSLSASHFRTYAKELREVIGVFN